MKPDTVLKWVNSGKLRSIRTRGGHCRIDPIDLQQLISRGNSTSHKATDNPATNPHTLRCWEYFAEDGQIQPECMECVVYQVRASWCFKIGTPGCELGPAKHLCRTPCNQCLYFQRVTGQCPHVLVITPDDRAIARLAEEQTARIVLGFARNGYEASAVLCDFRPMLVVVDEELVLSTEAGLLDYLACDTRVQGKKIVLAVGTPRAARWRGGFHKAVAAVLDKPIELERIEAVIRRYQVEQFQPRELTELIPIESRNGA